jgi:hypothetical protein
MKFCKEIEKVRFEVLVTYCLYLTDENKIWLHRQILVQIPVENLIEIKTVFSETLLR